MELLLQILELGFHVRGLLRLPLLDVFSGGEDEPVVQYGGLAEACSGYGYGYVDMVGISLHLSNPIIYRRVLWQSIQFRVRQLQHTLLAVFRGDLRANDTQLLLCKSGLLLDFLQQLTSLRQSYLYDSATARKQEQGSDTHLLQLLVGYGHGGKTMDDLEIL